MSRTIHLINQWQASYRSCNVFIEEWIISVFPIIIYRAYVFSPSPVHGQNLRKGWTFSIVAKTKKNIYKVYLSAG
jgi:hypothetical protein